MLRVIRWMSEATGRRECELCEELREELSEWERDVKAMSKMLCEAAVVGKKRGAGGKKKAEEPETEKAPEEPEAEKAVAVAPKKKAAAAKKAPEPEAVSEVKKEEVEWNVKVVVTTEEEEEEVEVEEMEYKGVKYLKSSRGVVYDIETSEEVGVWNEETKSIETD